MPKHMSLEERFWEKVDKTDSCWLWIGATKPHGYGNFNANGATVLPHRFAYEMLVGPIPDGLQIDHLCRVRNCVNPEHLEPVTQRTNNIRQERAPRTHCPHGHEFTPENVKVRASQPGLRWCRTCERAQGLAYKRKRQAARRHTLADN